MQIEEGTREITEHDYGGCSDAVRFSSAITQPDGSAVSPQSTHLGNSSVPIRFISSNQSHILHENAQTTIPARRDNTQVFTGNSFITAISGAHVFLSHEAVLMMLG